MRRTAGPTGATIATSGAADVAAPGVIVVAGAAPSVLLQACVVGLAVVDVGHQDRPGGRLPRAVGRDGLAAAVPVAHHQLRQDAEPAAVVVALPLEAEAAAVPAVA